MPTRQKPDAIALLKQDHRKVEKLFENFEKARDPNRKRALVQEICTELCIHTIIEEEISIRPARARSRTRTFSASPMSSMTAPRF